MNAAANLSRRSFLKATGWLGAGIAVSFASGCSLIPPIPKNPVPEVKDGLGWITLTPDGKWQLWSPRMEMGQNILGSLQQIAAIELGVPAAQILVALPSTSQIGRVKITAGSDSIREVSLPLAQACYTLRAAVLARAAERLGVDAAQLAFDGGDVVTKAGKRVPLRELAEQPLELKAQHVPTPELRFLNTPARTPPAFPQLNDILQGKALYAGDVRLPGMLYAQVLRPEWADQSLAPTALLTWDEAAVRAVAGFHSVVQDPRLPGPALVANRMGALIRMRELARPKWAEPQAPVGDVMPMIDVDAAIAKGRFTKTSGSVTQGKWTVDLRLDVPMAAHAFIEPRCAVAQLTSGGVKVWCGTQAPFYVRDVLQRDLALAEDKIEVQAMRVGGGFGGKTYASVEREAAVLAVLLKQPVIVQWSREDEFTSAAHRQPTSHRVQARLGANTESGHITDWRHSIGSSNVLFTNAIVPPWMNKLTNIIGDKGTSRGHVPLYAFAREQLDLQLTRLPVLTGPWRGLGAGPNVLAIEMAMDTAARAAKADPIEFRLRHLKNAATQKAGDPQRVALCLEALQTLLKKPRPATDLTDLQKKSPGSWKWFESRGIGAGCYKSMSYSAASAHLAIAVTPDGKLAAVRVLQLWCTHDCGLVIDADMVRAQVEGNLVWCLGMVLHEELAANNAGLVQRSLAQYNMARISDMPRLSIELLASTEPPTGAGETAMVSGAGAIANALCRALAQAGLPMPTRLPVRVLV
jgi:isoquinoline 1-oxidoreductase subunit beta